MIGGGCVGNVSSLGDGRNKAHGNGELQYKITLFLLKGEFFLSFYLKGKHLCKCVLVSCCGTDSFHSPSTAFILLLSAVQPPD
jgi:hypothetical protein